MNKKITPILIKKFKYISEDFKDLFFYLVILKKTFDKKKNLKMLWNVFWSKFHQNLSKNESCRGASPPNTICKMIFFRRKICFRTKLGPVQVRICRHLPTPLPKWSDFYEICGMCWNKWKINFPNFVIFIIRVVVKIYWKLTILWVQKWL